MDTGTPTVGTLRLTLKPHSDFYAEGDERRDNEAFELQRDSRSSPEREARPVSGEKGIVTEVVIPLASSGALSPPPPRLQGLGPRSGRQIGSSTSSSKSSGARTRAREKCGSTRRTSTTLCWTSLRKRPFGREVTRRGSSAPLPRHAMEYEDPQKVYGPLKGLCNDLTLMTSALRDARYGLYDVEARENLGWGDIRSVSSGSSSRPDRPTVSSCTTRDTVIGWRAVALPCAASTRNREISRRRASIRTSSASGSRARTGRHRRW